MLALLLAPFIISATFPLFVVAQGPPIQYDSAHNATDISGTWCTGSCAVQTGPGFANPNNYSFNYPAVAGRSFSFTTDGHFEQAEYRFTSNASDPHCITGVLTFQHGIYQLIDNGSIILQPIVEDGRQQVQNPCTAISNQITQWNTTVRFQSWRIFSLPTGGFHLNLYEFDGTPVAPMNLVAKPPNMLPNTQLTQPSDAVNAPAPQTSPSKRDGIRARSAASRTDHHVWSLVGLAALGSIFLVLLS